MSASINQINQAGNVVASPELEYTHGGTPVLNFRLAVNTYYKGGEQVLFIDCTVFGALAEILASRVLKGTNIFVSGELRQDEWTDKENKKQSKYYIKVNYARILGGSAESDGEDFS